MKDNTINNIGYTGIVTLSRYTGHKKVKIIEAHNEGKYPLFNFFTDCLIGDFDIAKIDRPTKIMLLMSNKARTECTSKSGFIYLLKKPEKSSVANSSAAAVKYSFIIPRDQLEGVTFNSIGLYTNSSTEDNVESYAAIVDIESYTEQELASSTALVVDWELIISNA